MRLRFAINCSGTGFAPFRSGPLNYLKNRKA